MEFNRWRAHSDAGQTIAPRIPMSWLSQIVFSAQLNRWAYNSIYSTCKRLKITLPAYKELPPFSKSARAWVVQLIALFITWRFGIMSSVSGSFLALRNFPATKQFAVFFHGAAFIWHGWTDTCGNYIWFNEVRCWFLIHQKVKVCCMCMWHYS